MSDIRNDVQDVFRTVFGEDDLVLKDETTADDIDGWDSIMHLNLMIALEKRFKIRFAAAEIAMIKDEGQNAGTLLAMIARKVQAK